MGFGIHNGHLARETLHAFAAGEVDPAQRAAIEAHLSRCDACAEHFAQARALLRTLEGMQPPPIDDLAWQRMGKRVLASLEAHAASELPRRRVRPMVWIGGSIATAAAIALAVWLAPYAPALAPKEIENAASPTIAAGDTPFQLSLTSGVVLRLAPHAQTRLLRDQRDVAHLELVQGELQIETPLPYRLPEIQVRTAAFRAVARSRAFTLSNLGSEAMLEVRSGQVRIQGEGIDQVVHAGERQTILFAPPTRRADPIAEVAAKPIARESPELIAPPAAVETKPRPPLRAKPAVDPEPVVAEEEPAMSEPTTSVEVTAPPEPNDPWQAALAAYERGDLERAIELSEQVLHRASQGPERRQALWILCEARLVRGDPARAVHACSELADSEPDHQAARALHYRIASMYRTRLNDCEQAIAHFGRVIVFGQHSFLDDQALLGRAACALDLQQLGVAERDLDALSTRLPQLERRDSYIDLVERLEAAKAQLKKDAGR